MTPVEFADFDSKHHLSIPSPMMTDDEDSDSGPHSGDSWHANDSRPGSPDSTADPSSTTATASANSALPTQKRRRVTRACDECRRKKIKCDGKSPCTHCTVYSYDCTYDKPSNRRRNPAPQYIEALENRLHLAETLLRKFMPDVDLVDPNLEPAVQQEFRKRAQARAKASKAAGTNATEARATAVATALAAASANRTGAANARPGVVATGDSNGDDGDDGDDGDMGLMLESIGQLQLDDGGWDFHGTSSGAVFLSRMMAHFGGRLGQAPFLPLPQTRPSVPSTAESSPSGPGGPDASPIDTMTSNGPELPPKDVVRSLCMYALTYGASLVRILHQPTFYERLDQLYDTPAYMFTEDDMRFLGLLYATMALGCMYRDLDTVDASATWQSAKEEGTRWYNLSGMILPNINDSRDITSLQALMFRILFLQSTSSLSTCYTLVGVAVRCALRMGLHRHLKHDGISPIEQEIRRRVFWSIRQMDIYVSVLLGFPVLLNADEIDQVNPTEVDDEYITQDGLLPVPPDTPSFMQPFNAMTSLMEILRKIARWVYPMRGVKSGFRPDGTETYRVGYAKLKEIEADLAKWYGDLPSAWRPSADGHVETVRVRHQLRFTYAHVQLVLYRPFLQYVSPRLSQQKKIDALSYACAAACINVSRNIIHIGSEIRKQGALSGSYWFMLYTEFFAALSLVFYVLENPEKPGSMDLLADARCARQNVAKLAHKSLAAETITSALNRLFDQLPRNLDLGKMAVASRKRAAPTPSLPSNSIAHQMQQSLQHRHSMDSRNSAGTSPGRGVSRRSTEGSMLDQPPKAAPHPAMEPSFGVNMHEFLTTDLSSARATPESGVGTPGSSQARLAEPAYQSPGPGAPAGGSGVSSNPLQKLNSLMFPTGDPFAYPMQPMMELGFGQNQQKGAQGMMAGSAMAPQQSLDSAQLFMTPGFDGLDRNFFGNLAPPQQQQQQQPHQHQQQQQPHQHQQQQQQHQQARQQQPPVTMGGMFDPAALLGLQSNGANLYQQQQRKMQGQGQSLDMNQQNWAAMWDFQSM